MSGAVPLPAAHIWKEGAASRARCPCLLGGVGGTGDPATAQLRALLRARVARRGGAGGAPPGGAPCAVAGDVRGVALLLSFGCRPSGSAALAVGAGVRPLGPGTPPLVCMLCGGLRAAGLVGGCPRGVWPPTNVRGVWCQELSLSWLPVSGAGSQDPLPLCPGHVCVGYGGPSTSPTACALSGWQEGVPRGSALRRCQGRLRSGACPPPAAGPQGGLSGSATHLPWARTCGRGGPAVSLWLACPAGGCVPRGGGDGLRPS